MRKVYLVLAIGRLPVSKYLWVRRLKFGGPCFRHLLARRRHSATGDIGPAFAESLFLQRTRSLQSRVRGSPCQRVMLRHLVTSQGRRPAPQDFWEEPEVHWFHAGQYLCTLARQWQQLHVGWRPLQLTPLALLPLH